MLSGVINQNAIAIIEAGGVDRSGMIDSDIAGGVFNQDAGRVVSGGKYVTMGDHRGGSRIVDR
jgi:hypothetical protein